MFITRVETLDGLVRVKVYSMGPVPKLLAWCACADTEQGRAAVSAVAGMAPALASQPGPLEVKGQPAGR